MMAPALGTGAPLAPSPRKRRRLLQGGSCRCSLLGERGLCRSFAPALAVEKISVALSHARVDDVYSQTRAHQRPVAQSSSGVRSSFHVAERRDEKLAEHTAQRAFRKWGLGPLR